VKPANAAQAGALSTPVLPSAQPEQTRQAPSRPGALVSHPLRVGVVMVATAALAFASYPTIARSALAAFFAGVLIVLAAIDLEHRIIPNKIVLPATAIVLAAHIAIEPGRTVELIVAPLAAAVFLFLPNLFTSSAIGMGDVKLALLLGAGLGWGVIAALLIGFLATVPFAIAVLIRGGAAARKTMLPLGPFLAFGGLVILIVPRL
jgi:leader peptidase (prepilin peptidase) / N-methyltransferase